MTSIEERIVSMGFDNSNFEKHAAQSLETLEKLESTLSSLGGKSGTLLVDALESISSKFSVLGTIGDEVLRKLADGLVNVAEKGVKLAESLSIDQITSGWSKYADKTQAVQTIMAATSKDWTDTGAQMEYVSGQLDKLNWFTDETSYSFLDMVNNIGKFTSNGIGLEESVTAMEGISTWAAISGANVSEAGRAMYNLSQALATGSVKLMDWKSIENANMATREFKETALETAVSLGTLTKATDEQGNAIYRTAKGHEFAAEQFNTYLSDAWFSKEVLTSTLNQYGSFANVLHDVSEETGLTATAILQEVDAYEKSGTVSKALEPYIEQLASAEYDLGRRAFKAAQEAKTFSEALEATKDAVSTGWMNTFESIFGNYEEAKVLWTSLANGLWEVFASNGETRNQALKLWRELGDRAKLFDEELGAIYKIGGNFITLFGEVQGALLRIFGPESVVPENIDEDVYQLYLILQQVTDKISFFADGFEKFTNKLIKSNAISKIIDSFHNLYMGIKVPFEVLSDTFHKTFDPIFSFPTEHPWAIALANAIIDVSKKLKTLSENFREFMESSETMEKLYNIAYGVMAVFKMALSFVSAFVEEFKQFAPMVTSAFTHVLNVLSNVGQWFSKLKNTLEYYGVYEKVAQTLANIFSAWASYGKFIISIFEGVFRVLGNNFDLVLKFGGKVLEVINTVSNYITNFFNDSKISEISKSFTDALQKVFDFFRKPEVVADLQKIATAIKSAFEIVLMVFNAIKTEAQKLFPDLGKWFQTLLHDFASLVDWITKIKTHLQESGALERIFTTLGNVFRAFSSVAEIAYNIIKSIFKVIGNNLHVADGLGGKILDLIDKFTTWIVKLKESHDWGEKFSKIFESVHKVIEGVIGALEKVVGFFTKGNLFETIANAASKAWETIKKVFESIKKGLAQIFSGGDGEIDPLKMAGTFGIVALTLKKLFSKDQGIFGKLFGGDLVKSFKDTLSSIGDALDSLVGGKDDIIKKIRNLAISLGILAVAIAVVAAIKPDKLAIAFAALSGGLAEMVTVITIMDELDLEGKQVNSLLKIAGAMLAFGFALGEVAVAMVIFSAAVWVISKINPDRLWGSIAALATALGAMTAALFVLAKFCSGGDLLGAGTAILEVALALDMLTLALAALSFIKPEKLNKALKTIAAGLMTMTMALLILAGICEGGDLLGAGTAILEVALAMDLLAVAIAGLSLVKPEKLNNSLKTLATGLLAMTMALLILAETCDAADLIGAAAAIVIVAVALDLLAVGLAGLSLLDSEKLLASVVSLGIMLATIAIVLAVLAEIGPKAIAAAAALLLVSAAVDLLAVGMLIASKAIDNIAEAMPKLAEGMKSFEGINWMTILKAGVTLAAVISALFLLEFATIHNGVPVLEELAQALPDIANGFKAFETLDPDAIVRGSDALTAAIKALFKLQFSTILDGVPVLMELSTALPMLAMGFKHFEILDPDAIIKGGNALAEAVKSLFKLQFSTLRDGTPELIHLGMALPSIVQGFKYFEFVNDEAIIRGAAALATAVASLFTLQFASLRDGTPELVKLGNAMPTISAGFSSFNDLDAEKISTVGEALSRAIKSLFGLQFASFKDGTAQLTNLGNALPPLAAGFKAFEGIDGSRIEELCTSLQNGIKTLTGNVFKNLFKGDTGDFTTIAVGLSTLAAAVNTIPANASEILTNLADGITKASSTAVTEVEKLAKNVIDSLTKMVKDADGVTKELIPNMVKAINRSGSSLEQSLNSIANIVKRAMDSYGEIVMNSISTCQIAVSTAIEVFYTYGYNMGANLARGMNDSVSEVQQAAQNLENAAQVDTSSASQQSYNAGTNVGSGMAEGISDSTSQVEKSSGEMAGKIGATVKKKLKVRSPSRVMMEIGGYITKGLSLGIQNGSEDVEDSMITVINPVLAALNQLMDEDYDISPKITPVVDMSNVNEMAGVVDSLLTKDTSYTVNAARRVSANESISGGSFGNYNSVGDTINASINVYAQAGQDVNELARVIERRLVRLNKQQQVGAL